MSYSDTHREPPDPTRDTWRRNASFGEVVDIADKLPDRARVKLKGIRAQLDDARTFSRATNDKYQEKRVAILSVERRIVELRSERVYSRYTLPMVDAETEALEKLCAERAELTEIMGRRRNVCDALGLLVRALESYAPRVSPSVESAPLRKTSSEPDPRQSVEKIRARCADLRVKLQATIDAPIHSTEAKTIARQHIESLAAAGKPNVFTTLEARRAPALSMRSAGRVIIGDGVGTLDDVIDVEATLAWLFKEHMIAALEREIDEAADDASALTDEVRAGRLHKLKAELLSAEREEEALIEQAEAQNVTILRRPDADPRAVLGLADSAPAPQ